MMELKKWVQKPKRAFIVGIILGTLIFGSLAVYFAPLVRGANASIGYASPDNGATFVSVDAGDGVTITVNVTDSDSDLAQVEIWSNASGSWSALYQSGALGGVGYHNHSVVDPDALESWTLYYYNISAWDTSTGDWTNVTYSYTTDYMWGDPHCIVESNYNCYYPSIYKNNTDDYFLSWTYYDSYDIRGKHSGMTTIDTLTEQSTTTIEGDTRVRHDYYNADFFGAIYTSLYSYDGKCYIAYTDDIGDSDYGDYYTKYYWGGSWTGKTTTGIHGQRDWYKGVGYSTIYYDGVWWTFYGGIANERGALYRAYGNAPWGTSDKTLIDQYGTGNRAFDFLPSTAILDGYLVMVYRDKDENIDWYTYDGNAWVHKGDVIAVSGASGITTYPATWYHRMCYGLSITKDPVAQQLVMVYVRSNVLYYRILESPTGSWSAEKTLFTPEGGYNVLHPCVRYIDDRLTVAFSYNYRGTYDIYTINSHDDRSNAKQGIVQRYGRYQFPDASPSDTNINSTVVMYENTGATSWISVNLSTGDIGEIQCENNFRFWFSLDNVTFTNVGTTDGSGDINDINSTNFPALFPLVAGDELYVKWEILDVGAVSEDLHSTDYTLRWEIWHP